jgi:tetratricopeptide (TPR) repeat protein
MAAPVSSPCSSWRHRLLALVLLGVIAAAVYPATCHLRADYHLRQAEKALAADNLDEAGVHLAECLAAWPDSGRAHFLAARTARRCDLYDEAAEHLGAAQKVLGRGSEVLLEWAMLDFQRSGSSPGVETYLRNAFAADPPEADLILEALAQGFMRGYCLQQARSCLDEWVRRRPGAVGARLRRGWVHERLDHLPEAEADYRAALEHHPNHPIADLRLAQLLLLAHRGSEAEAHFRGLLDRQPDNRAARLGLAAGLASEGQLAEARPLLDELLAAHPDDADVLLERGKLALEEGEYEAAQGWLSQAAERQPHDYATQYQLLLCLQRAGRQGQALTQQRRVQALSADLEEVHKLADLLLARPRDPDLRCRIGQVFLRCGEEREGVLWLESVLQAYPDHAAARQALAEHRARQS